MVVSPFFLWSKAEIAQAEKFVADGGRLLLISDPDVVGDLAQDINNLAEPFGIVFADDYLYDTVNNDGNHVYVFQSEFVDDAAHLTDSRIALYGARTISGEGTPQALTSDTTLSSLREGLTGLSTLVKGGLETRGTQGGVLAMSDFDVMTAPFVERHDNARLTEHVAEFLASGERTQSVTDFPAYLGKNVMLVFANTTAVDAEILREGSRLQQSLEETGRSLSISGAGVLTETLSAETPSKNGGAGAPLDDLIVLADFTLAGAETALLSDLGFALVEATPTPVTEGAEAESTSTQAATKTPTPTGSPTATPTATPEDAGAEEASPTAAAPSNSRRSLFPAPVAQNETDETPEALLTPTATFTPVPTATPSPTVTPTPSPTTTPMPEVYLETDDGLRLVAAETVLIAQRELEDGRRLVAVLGNDNAGIRSGVDRLLEGAFMGCVTSADLAVCSGPNGGNGTTRSAAPVETEVETEEETPEAVAAPSYTATPAPASPRSKFVLVVDDNDAAAPGETSEADRYLMALTQQGYGPTLWLTASDGIPTLDDLTGYDWVIWSGGGYESGGPGLADMEGLLAYMNAGGALTISSRRPFFGMSTEEASVIADVAVEEDLPELVLGLPSTTIRLGNGLPPVTPLEISEDNAEAKVALVRGPDSNSAGAPLLFVVTDDSGDEPTGARLMVLGMSLTWLPDDFDQQLVRNMTGYMLDD